MHVPTPTDAIAAGIGMVHQHFMLADNFTVLENIVLGSEPDARRPARRRGRPRRGSSEISDSYGLGLDPDALVEDLGVGDRQRVEILKVLYRGARILILDEPTAVLVPQEVDELFGNLARAQARGPDRHLHLAQARRGAARSPTRSPSSGAARRSATADPKAVTARQLAEMMVGSELPSPETRESTVTDHVGSASTASRPSRSDGRPRLLDDITLRPSTRARSSASPASRATARPSWSRRSSACVRPTAGSVTLGRRGHHRLVHPSAAARPASAYIPEDRHRQALLLERAAVGEPRCSATRRQHARPPRAASSTARRARADTERIMREYDVRAPGAGHAGRRAVRRQPAEADRRPRDERRPERALAAHPTRGVDVGAQAAIWDRIRDARADGPGARC